MAQKISPSARRKRAWREWNDAVAGLNDADSDQQDYRQ